ncbi:MAG: sigma-54-dependent Fis family transcriptional regulator, partial [Desulfovibrionaceae bacterium]|nr:sigma-54-dependent Fis family transcriptional regulator [Desulfovibrionaceae bacterium]
MAAQILIVDDDEAHRKMLKTLLKSWHYQVLEALDGDEAIETVKQQSVDVVLSDVRMARVDGLEALSIILDYNPALPVILMTAYSSVETAVQALREGAFDYLIKPLDFTALKNTLARDLAQSGFKLEPKELRKQVALGEKNSEILARSPAMEKLLETIAQVAPTEATVLICGESGTGKELVAKAL